LRALGDLAQWQPGDRPPSVDHWRRVAADAAKMIRDHQHGLGRLLAVEKAAKRLRIQRRKYKTLGCNWTCRAMLDLFTALEPEEG
jgi:hypothetical protein